MLRVHAKTLLAEVCQRESRSDCSLIAWCSMYVLR